jgi:hypothetical protein
MLSRALLLACAALLVAVEAQAQVRGSRQEKPGTAQSAAAHAAKLGELDAWLGRLKGRFHVSRRGRFMSLEDCTGFGDGPGIHCVIGPPQNALTVSAPTMILYGLDPDAPGVRYLQVNGRSIAEGDLGKLSGDTVTFSKVPCPKFVDEQPRIAIMTCDRKLRIYAPPHGRYILYQYITEQLVVVPTPRSGRRPLGQIATELVQFSDNIRLQRVPADQERD